MTRVFRQQVLNYLDVFISGIPLWALTYISHYVKAYFWVKKAIKDSYMVAVARKRRQRYCIKVVPTVELPFKN